MVQHQYKRPKQLHPMIIDRPTSSGISFDTCNYKYSEVNAKCALTCF